MTTIAEIDASTDASTAAVARGDVTVLREGMLFTVEPSILQDHGLSARTEDVVVARPGGGERLTAGFRSCLWWTGDPGRATFPSNPAPVASPAAR